MRRFLSWILSDPRNDGLVSALIYIPLILLGLFCVVPFMHSTGTVKTLAVGAAALVVFIPAFVALRFGLFRSNLRNPARGQFLRRLVAWVLSDSRNDGLVSAVIYVPLILLGLCCVVPFMHSTGTVKTLAVAACFLFAPIPAAVGCGIGVFRWRNQDFAIITPALLAFYACQVAARQLNMKAGLHFFQKKKGVYVGCALEVVPSGGPRASCALEPLRFSGDGHVLTIGKTGKGKGSSVIVPALLDYKGSVFVVDPKGQLAAITSSQRQAMGQKTYYLNPFDMHGIPSSSYNPLDFIDPKALDFESQCASIAEGLIEVVKRDHWEMSALDLVSLLIQWVVLEGEKNDFPRDIISVREILSFSIDHRIKFFREMTGSEHPHIAQGAARYAGESKEVQDCVQTANMQLAFLRNTGYERIFRREENGLPAFSFATLKKELATVYLIIPAKDLNIHGRFLRLLFMSAYNELMNIKHRQAEDVLFLLDEFLQLGHLASIGGMSRVCRDYQLRLWLIIQDLPGFKGVYKEEWESLIANAGILQFFGADDVTTMDYIEKLSGVEEVMVPTESETDSTTDAKSGGTSSGSNSGGGTSSGSNDGWSISRTRSKSKSFAPRIDPKIRRQAARAMQNHEQLIFISGHEYGLPVLRFPYWKLYGDYFAGLDPFHMDDETRERWLDWIKRGDSFFTNPAPDEFPLVPFGMDETAQRLIDAPDHIDRAYKKAVIESYKYYTISAQRAGWRKWWR